MVRPFFAQDAVVRKLLLYLVYYQSVDCFVSIGYAVPLAFMRTSLSGWSKCLRIIAHLVRAKSLANASKSSGA